MSRSADANARELASEPQHRGIGSTLSRTRKCKRPRSAETSARAIA
jgi:hypothetical protein